MNWGLLSPGDLKNYVVYLRNNGSVPMRLSIASSNWNPPAASSYFAFAWNSTGVTVNIGSLVPAKLTLAVSSGISGITNFAFDITITGTETQ